MSSMNNSSATVVPTETSEKKRNECSICERTLASLTKTIGKKIVEGAHKNESTSFTSMYKVPEELRKLKESAYSPRLASIGPLHSKEQHNLKSSVQNSKMSYVDSLLCRTVQTRGSGSKSDESKSMLLMECVSQMRQLLDDAKKCYAEEVEALDEEMLLIDGCFILELLYRGYHGESPKSSDPIFNNKLSDIYIRHDLLLLENQLPFSVLRKLFDLTVARIDTTAGSSTTSTSPPNPVRPLSHYVISFFGGLWKSEQNGTPPPNKGMEEDKYQHILHIIHYHYSPDDAGKCGSIKFMPCASNLEYAGVKFVVGPKVKFGEPEGPSRWYDRAKFEIPSLYLYDYTEPFLRNLIAFEQCCSSVPSYFTSYALFMDTLINTPQDVQVLEKAEIIHNFLGASEDAAVLFNNLCKEVVLSDFYFSDTIRAADDYSRRCWPDAMAHLRRKYFATPWTFIAFCAGFVTFGISVFKFIRGNFRS